MWARRSATKVVRFGSEIEQVREGVCEGGVSECVREGGREGGRERFIYHLVQDEGSL